MGEMSYNFCVPCLFGLEGLCADELRRLGMDSVSARDGQVTFSGDEREIARANINLRTGERILLITGVTNALTFDELFEGVKAMPWERFIPENAAFPVKGHSLGSKLHSVPDCQKIIKKAIAEHLIPHRKSQWIEETGAKCQVQFAIMNDIATLYIDTTGAGLHKRGYRPVSSAAPLRETLAAAIVKLSRYKGREEVCDPFCGSGTIPIEAAMAALNRAPGLGRKFAAQEWSWLEEAVWAEAKQEARDREFSGDYDICGSDIDPGNVAIAEANAKRAGVSGHIRFEVADAKAFARERGGGIIMANPPYGERVMERSEAEDIYRDFGAVARKLDNWKMYILSSHTEFERTFGKSAVKRRKLYNGMIMCNLYMYY